MEKDWIDINDQLPERGKDIIAICDDGLEHELFLCSCPHNCRTWKCSLLGYSMILDVVKWKYVQSHS